MGGGGGPIASSRNSSLTACPGSPRRDLASGDCSPSTGKGIPSPCGREPGSTRLPCSSMKSEEHTSELQSLMRISYAVFCLNKTNKHTMIINKNVKPTVNHN